MHIKTVILLGNFFHLVCVMLLICQQRFLFNVFSFFIFFIKNAFFILVVNVFLHLLFYLCSYKVKMQIRYCLPSSGNPMSQNMWLMTSHDIIRTTCIMSLFYVFCRPI